MHPWAGSKIDKVAGIEARGFILGGAVAHQVSAGFVPIRKKGKLPHTTVRIAYSLEYGIDEMEMHADAIQPGERVILVDDLIATGGTAEGAVKLLRQIGANVVAACFIIDLPDLGGAAKLRAMDVPVRTLMAFDGQLERAEPSAERTRASDRLGAELRAPMLQALLQQRVPDVGRLFLVQPLARLEREILRPMRGPGGLQAAAGVAALAQREPDPVLNFLEVGRLSHPLRG